MSGPQAVTPRPCNPTPSDPQAPPAYAVCRTMGCQPQAARHWPTLPGVRRIHFPSSGGIILQTSACLYVRRR
jgi:hypothetical protein